ncbi:MAG: extracellular matrix regulator RemB [Thermoanaerobacteraceae bacterium]
MYINLGGNIVIPDKEIIAIFDISIASISESTVQFLKISEEEDFIVKVSDEKPKSFIITERDKRSIIYLSPISTFTLIKRTQKIEE